MPVKVLVPPIRRSYSNSWLTRANQMMVGQSVLLASTRERNNLLQAGNRAGGKFVSRKIDAQGWRVWRIR